MFSAGNRETSEDYTCCWYIEVEVPAGIPKQGFTLVERSRKVASPLHRNKIHLVSRLPTPRHGGVYRDFWRDRRRTRSHPPPCWQCETEKKLCTKIPVQCRAQLAQIPTQEIDCVWTKGAQPRIISTPPESSAQWHPTLSHHHHLILFIFFTLSSILKRYARFPLCDLMILFLKTLRAHQSPIPRHRKLLFSCRFNITGVNYAFMEEMQLKKSIKASWETQNFKQVKIQKCQF